MEWPTLIAGYAAGVSTIVALRQILVELPKVRIGVFRDAQLMPQGTRVMVLDVTNAGRRPVIVNMVGYLGSEEVFLGIPILWGQEVPFRLEEGETRSLQIDPSQLVIPEDAVFVARDTVGRWWPRRRRLQVWVRGRIAKRRQLKASGRER